MRKWRSAIHDLPAAIGLAAGGAVRALRLAIDGDLLLVFAAVGPLRGLVRARRRDAAGIAGVWIFPGRGLASRRLFQSILRRLICITPVVLVKHVADSAANEATQQRAGHDPRTTAAQGRPEKTASRGTAETPDRGLGAASCVIHVLAGRQQ